MRNEFKFYHQYKILPTYTLIIQDGAIAVKLKNNNLLFPVDNYLVDMQTEHDMDEWIRFDKIGNREKQDYVKLFIHEYYQFFRFTKLPNFNKKEPMYLVLTRTLTEKRKYNLDIELAIMDESLEWSIIRPHYQYPLCHTIKDDKQVIGWLKLQRWYCNVCTNFFYTS